MSSCSIVIGSESATPLQPPSPFLVCAQSRLSTVQDLLEAVKTLDLKTEKVSMFGTVAIRLSEFANVPVSNLPIEKLLDTDSFADWLRQRRYSVNSVRAYCNHARQLLRHAEKLGWISSDAEVISAWKPIVAALKRAGHVPSSLVRFAIVNGKKPAAFSDADLQNWGETMIHRGRQYKTTRMAKSRFRKAVLDAGLERLLPNVNLHPQPCDYGIRTADMPEPLRSEVLELLRWKTARYAKGRPQHGHLRPVSARLLEKSIDRLYGFAMRVSGHSSIRTLLDLLTPEIMDAFVDWSLNERNVSSESLRKFAMLYSAVRFHPAYKTRDWKWFGEWFAGLPEDPKSERKQRKEQKCMPYDQLCLVPERIREVRERTSKKSIRTSWLVHDELLFRFLLTLAWRQRNIRECRLGSPEADNLFYAELPTMTHVARPEWVVQALHDGSQQKFWQFFFREPEVKIDREVRGILPRSLVPLLEEYLHDHRPHLVGQAGTTTLFLNRDGGPLDRQTTTDLVAELVLKYAGKRVTPHRFRDSFAYKWLEGHPEDYLTLSKILWHQDVQTTIDVYGAQFDESNGVCRIDDWLQQMSANSTHPPQA